MRIALIDSFFDTSHRIWAEGLKAASSHDIDIYSGSSHHWKWKMTGGTMDLAKKFAAQNKVYDLIIVTDMVHLPLFRSLLPQGYWNIPVVLYFHENQITYPWSANSKGDHQDRHYGWINYISAVQADQLVFNSDYHRRSFLSAIPKFFKPFPKSRWQEDYILMEAKSSVLPIGLQLPVMNNEKRDTPTFLWNHRWEYDKDPELFFQTLIQLSERGIDFKLIVLGRAYANAPDIFEEARSKLSAYIIHWGWAESREDYNRLLAKANIILVTSRQDFFGISIVEAIAAGCFPLLPDRLAYREHIPVSLVEDSIYEEDRNLLPHLLKVIESRKYMSTREYASYVRKYDWSNLVPSYDAFFKKL